MELRHPIISTSSAAAISFSIGPARKPACSKCRANRESPSSCRGKAEPWSAPPKSGSRSTPPVACAESERNYLLALLRHYFPGQGSAAQVDWVHACSGAQIGSDCSLGRNVFVGNRVRIGHDVKIQNNVSEHDNVTLEDDVFCGPSMVFTNYNPRSHVSRKHEYRDTLVRRSATLGANCTIVCGVTIGEYAFVAAGAVVKRDVKPFALIAGVPARQIGWVSARGERLDLPVSGEGEARCPATGTTYRLVAGNLSCESSTPVVQTPGEGKDAG